MSTPPTLSDGYVTLRAFTAEDLGWVHEACQDEGIARFTMVPSPYTPADAEDFVLELAATSWREEGYGPLAVVDADEGTGLGSVGVAATGPDVAELGYWVAPWARRRGVGSAALALLTTWVQLDLGLARCELHVDAANEASIATALRAGYHHEDPATNWLPRRGLGEGTLLVSSTSA